MLMCATQSMGHRFESKCWNAEVEKHSVRYYPDYYPVRMLTRVLLVRSHKTLGVQMSFLRGRRLAVFKFDQNSNNVNAFLKSLFLKGAYTGSQEPLLWLMALIMVGE